jgi:hypothetical protein
MPDPSRTCEELIEENAFLKQKIQDLKDSELDRKGDLAVYNEEIQETTIRYHYQVQQLLHRRKMPQVPSKFQVEYTHKWVFLFLLSMVTNIQNAVSRTAAR